MTMTKTGEVFRFLIVNAKNQEQLTLIEMTRQEAMENRWINESEGTEMSVRIKNKEDILRKQTSESGDHK
jgi:hypothetical protein